MAVTASQLVVKIEAQGADETKQKLSDVGKSADQVQGGFKGMLSNALSLAGGFAIFNIGSKAIGFLKDQISDTIQVTMQHQDVMAQTTQVIKSTGDASHMSAQSISDLAESLSKTTKFSQDVTQSGENLLLTFTGIGKDVFPAATKTMLDMSQAMGGDVKGAAIQLGKALNDPAQGLSALSRVGVTFTDQQKAMIKQMVAVGDVAGAQKIMLAELQREFGGSAEAAGKTFGGQLQILKNNLEDVKIKIGTALLPVLTSLTSGISSNVLPVLDRFGDWFSKKAVPAIEGFRDAVGGSFTYVGNVLRSINLSDFKDAWTDLKEVVGEVGQAFQGLGARLHPVAVDFDPLADVIAGLAKGGLSILTSMLWKAYEGLSAISEAIHGGKGPLSDFANIFKDFGPPLKNIAGLLGGELKREFGDLGALAKQVGGWFKSDVVPAIQDAWPGFKNLALTILNTVIPAFISIRGVVVDVIEHAFKTFGPMIEKIVPPLIRFAGIIANDVANGIKIVTPYVLEAVKALGKFADEVMDRVAPIVSGWIKTLTPLVQVFMSWWSSNWPMISAVLKGTWDEIVGIVKIAWALVSGIVKIGLDILSGNWGQAWTDFKDMLKGVWDGIKTYVKGAIETLIGLFRPMLEAMSHIPGPAGDMAKGVLNAFGNMKTGAKQHTDEMKTNLLTHTEQMHMGAVNNLDKMRQELIFKMKSTKDPVVQHALEMKINSIAHMEQMHVDAAKKADAMKNEVTNHAKNMSKGVTDSFSTMKDGSNLHSTDMKTKVLDNTSKMHIEAANHLDTLKNDLIDKMKNTSDPVQKHALAMKLGVVEHMERMHIDAAAKAKAMKDKVVGHTSDMTTNSKGALDRGAGGIQSSMSAPFLGALGTIGGVFAAIGNLIGDATTFNWGAIPGDLHALHIPGFAEGTNYAPGGWAMVGEQGPELMQVPRGSQIIPNHQLGSVGSSAPIVHIHNYINGKEITDDTANRMIKSRRTNGPIRSTL